MLVTGRFGLKSYSLADPAHPKFLDEVTAEELRLPGDPPVLRRANPQSTFWQNEDMDVDQRRKLALLSRDPRAYRGSTTREPGEADPNGATNIAGVYIVDAKDPADLKLLTFKQLPTGHTTSCVNDCEWLWTGGPASTTTQAGRAGWTCGRPIIVTDLREPEQPDQATRCSPVDLFRQDGVTAYSHDVDVDAAGVAWVSGLGGTRGYWTEGVHHDPVDGRGPPGDAARPDPVRGRRPRRRRRRRDDDRAAWMHNAWRPVGKDAPRGRPRATARASCCSAPRRTSARATRPAASEGKFTHLLAEGLLRRRGLALDAREAVPPEARRLLEPADKEGTVRRTSSSCSAHYFDVDGPLVDLRLVRPGHALPRHLQAGEPDPGRLLPPRRRQRLGVVLHKGYVYTADHARGVDILKLGGGAKAACRSPEGSRRAEDVEEAGLVPAEHGIQALGLGPVDRRALPAGGRRSKRVTDRGGADRRPRSTV